MHRPVILGACVLTTLVLGSVAPAAAWEDDLHFGLTKWLAQQAGFVPSAAEMIAKGDQHTDEGIRDARYQVFWYACLGSEPSSAELVRDLHFPTFAKIPNLPVVRKVRPGGPAATRPSELEVNARTPQSADEKDAALAKLGEALHVLQDSWSHQGEPDTPSGCRKDLAWAHPKARGGWKSHEADYTYYMGKGQGDAAVKAAQMTLTHLLMHAKKKPWAVGQQPPREWAALEADVTLFVKARTKTEKAQWFTKQGFTDVTFLTATTLPDGDEPLTRQLQFAQFSRPASSTPAALGTSPVPADVMTFMRNFWNEWVVTTNFASLVLAYVAPAPFVKSLGLTGDPQAITESTLALWRLRDHGLVALVGHVPPATGSQAAKELSSVLQDRNAFVSFDGLRYAMLGLGKNGPPVVVVAAGSGRYAAFGRFRHAPHDVVMVTAEQVQGSWRVMSLQSVVEH